MSPAKALRRSLSRAADLLWGLALVAQDISIETLNQDGVVEALRPGELLILLDGPEGALGLVTIDREVMTALIEVQTIQQVTQMPVEDRPLTPTDAAMCAPLIDATLLRLLENLAGHPLYGQIEGFRYGAMIEDARAASLLLEAESYRAFRADVDLALGRRRGALSIVLPVRVPKIDPAAAARLKGPNAELLERVPARLDAVLARLRLPLAKAQALQPGDLVMLPVSGADGVEFLAGKGQLVAKGRLGQLDGMRAVRLTWPPVEPAGGAPGGASGGESFAESDFGGGGVDAPDMSGAGMEGGDFGGDMSFDSAPEPSFDGGMDGTMDGGMEGGMEDLPDLPPMDFASEAESFDMDFGADLPDLDGESAELPDLGDFSAAPMEVED